MKKLLLVDGHGLAFRGFYALPEMRAADGTPTNAVLGFVNMLLKAMDEWTPDGIGLFFDPKGPTARNEMYDAYKEGRKPTPEEFKAQMPLILELSTLLGYPVFVRDGVEADDLIASTATAAAAEGIDALILSADKDLLQLLRGNIRMARPTKGISEFKLYDEKSFTEEYGFTPKAMADYLALVGDAVDNIPGVAGIGDKTARALLATHGSLDDIYRNLDALPKGQKLKLENGREAAYKSYALIVPQDVEAIGSDRLIKSPTQKAEASALCARLGLKKIISRLSLDTADAPNNNSASPKKKPVPVQAEAEAVFGEKWLTLSGTPDLVMTDEGQWTALSGALPAFRKWIESDGVCLVLADYRKWCAGYDFLAANAAKVFDVELAHYFYHPDAKTHAISSSADDGAEPTEAACELLSLYREYTETDQADAMARVMREIDAPLTPVLLDLQRAGLYVDADALKSLEADLQAHIQKVERSIFETAGGVINLNSPKQVGELLFEQLHLPVVKKTKTGYSTDVGVLEELARLPDPLGEIPTKMLDFRECAKMSSGFVQPFLKHLAEASDGRIHSTFLHAVTGTARLASRDPNVQNLPVFGEWAARFRQTIVPADASRIFVAADYSQIELRVLAHLSGEKRLLAAFKNGRDIHLETASWVFDIEPQEITPEQRRFAKTVNFGLIYGMGAHGLAQRMGIPRHQAANLVDRYFSVLPRVKSYLEKSAKEARARGYTVSIFGRIRPLAEVATIDGRGGNPIDRVAVNTPIQSTAADIAKIALIRFHEMLQRRYPHSKLVLQVHDSLICETPQEYADEIERVLIETMETVAAIDVPLKAEPKRGRSLADV